MTKGVKKIVGMQYIFLIFFFIFLISFTSWNYYTFNSFAQEIPETIIIEHDIHRLDRFGPVRFGHRQHIELGLLCKKCHHDWNEYSSELPVGCIACHGKDTQGDVVSLRTAYLKSCLGCHMLPGEDGNKKGPTVCTDCHLYKKF